MLARVKRMISAELTHAEHDGRQHQVVEALGQRRARIAVARHRKPAERAPRRSASASGRTRSSGTLAPSIAKPVNDLVDRPCRARPPRRCRRARRSARRWRSRTASGRTSARRAPHSACVTGRCRKIDWPRLPLRELAQPQPELHRQRLVEAVDRRARRAMSSAVAWSPSSTAAGRPARARVRKNTSVATSEHHDQHAAEARREVARHGASSVGQGPGRSRGSAGARQRRCASAPARTLQPSTFQKNGQASGV